MWYPPSYVCWFTTTSTRDISTISSSEIGVICTNLAIELGHHFVVDITIQKVFRNMSRFDPYHFTPQGEPFQKRSRGKRGLIWDRLWGSY